MTLKQDWEEKHRDDERIMLVIKSVSSKVCVVGKMLEAHGKGFDGSTEVHSLKVGESLQFPGKVFVQDTHGNTIMATPDELLAAARAVAPKHLDVSVRPKVTAAKTPEFSQRRRSHS